MYGFDFTKYLSSKTMTCVQYSVQSCKLTPEFHIRCTFVPDLAEPNFKHSTHHTAKKVITKMSKGLFSNSFKTLASHFEKFSIIVQFHEFLKAVSSIQNVAK